MAIAAGLLHSFSSFLVLLQRVFFDGISRNTLAFSTGNALLHRRLLQWVIRRLHFARGEVESSVLGRRMPVNPGAATPWANHRHKARDAKGIAKKLCREFS